MSDIIYLSAPETPTTPIREQLLTFALSAMASPDMPDHWAMLIDFASYGDKFRRLEQIYDMQIALWYGHIF